jgi:DNA-3-methyladenine glycosylase II
MNNAFYSIIKIDESFKKIFEQFGLPLDRAIKQGFESLGKIIIGQQISTNVAKSLSDKLKKDGMLTEKKVFAASIEELKFYGLSSQKIFYLKNLATLAIKNKIDINSLNKLKSNEVTNLLIEIKGIGHWTINNYKIFALQDTNAWPSADLALQEAVKRLKGLETRPNEKDMEKIGKMWEPHRAAAALFLWHFYNKVKIEKAVYKL